MATAFESSLSSSTMRTPFVSAGATSMADSLPSINFGFEELREQMAKFTVRFDTFIDEGRKRVLEERNAFKMNVAELKEDQRMKKRDIEYLSQKSSSHQQTLAKEAAEANEMKAAIASLKGQKDAHQATREGLRKQIAETQKQIDAKLAAQRAYAQHIDSQSRFNIPELDFWQNTLCMDVIGAGMSDHIKFVFTHIDDKDWNREAWFELDVGKREYEIPYCKPKLETEQVERIVDKFNEDRKLETVLKGMRGLFVEAMMN